MMRYAALVILAAALAGTAAGRCPARPARIVARIVTGNGPCSENAGFGSLWVSNIRDNTVARVDPATNKVVGKVKVGLGPCGVVVRRRRDVGRRLQRRRGRARRPGHDAGRREDPDRPTALGHRLRRRVGVGDEHAEGHRRADRPCDEQGDRTDQGRQLAAAGPLRRRRDLGRQRQGQEHLADRPGDEQGEGDPDRPDRPRLARRLRQGGLGRCQLRRPRRPARPAHAEDRRPGQGRLPPRQPGVRRRRERLRPGHRRGDGGADRPGAEQGDRHVVRRQRRRIRPRSRSATSGCPSAEARRSCDFMSADR